MSRERWVRTWVTLSAPVRRRLVLEHDDLRFSASDTLWIHARTGVRLVFDHLLEAKAKDLALHRLRADLDRYGGGRGLRFGVGL